MSDTEDRCDHQQVFVGLGWKLHITLDGEVTLCGLKREADRGFYEASCASRGPCQKCRRRYIPPKDPSND